MADEFVVMNVVEVPSAGRVGFEDAFARRQSRLNEVEGFAGFELMRRDDVGEDGDASEFLVISRWRDEAAFIAWREGDAFKEAHRNADPDSRPQGQRPTNSEVRKYTVVQSEPAPV